MSKSYKRACALLFLILTSTPRGATSQEPSVKEIAERYVTARGGMDRILSVRTLILRGPPRADGRPGRFMVKARPYYWMVGEPSPTRDYAEGFDGSHWEFYGNPGLVIRPTGEPAAAGRHTAYFDDPLVYVGQTGWSFEKIADAHIGADDAYGIRTTMPDGFQRDIYVSKVTWLVIAVRAAAPVHAFGPSIRSETRISDYRPLNGALFPMRFDSYDIETGVPTEVGVPWATAEVNIALPLDYFSPPKEPATPLARMLNAVYASRSFPSDALLWITDFHRNPATADIDTEAGVESTAYQILKSGMHETAIAILEANAREHPRSAAAHFGLGRAYRSAGRETNAMASFNAALAIDPSHRPSLDAIQQGK
jgi:hypothetical protein